MDELNTSDTTGRKNPVQNRVMATGEQNLNSQMTTREYEGEKLQNAELLDVIFQIPYVWIRIFLQP